MYPNGDEVSNIEIIYVCRKYHGELKRQEEEIEELKFFNIAEVELDNISPPIRPVVKQFIEQNSISPSSRIFPSSLESAERSTLR